MIYLEIAYAQKDEAKPFGVRWDPKEKLWYFPGDVLPEELECFRPAKTGKGPVKKIILDIPFSYRDIADHVATINRLSSQAASEREPGALTVVKMIANPAWRFLNFYFLRGGFREGGRGLYAAMSAAFYVFLKYAKLYERRLRTQRRL